MSRMLLAPGRYIQGPGAINEIGTYAARLGTKAMVIGGPRALGVAWEAVKRSLDLAGVSSRKEGFNGQCSQREINRLLDIGQTGGHDLVISVGGGKAIDTGKAVAHNLKTPVMVVPTIAATDAPCSAISIIYTDEGVFEQCLGLPQNPDCVLVDTTIVSQAPVDLLVSGMGDALATFWEADTCARSCKPNVLTGATPPTLTAMALARLCYDTLLEYGYQARLAVENKVCTPAVEAIVEANTLLSGLGFESGGLAGAHSLHNGLTVLESTHGKYHGQKVAFGLIMQLVMEGRPRTSLDEVVRFCLSVGLPVCLADIGVINPTQEEIRRVAEATTAKDETIHSTWFPVTPEMVEAAIWAADALGRSYKFA